MVWNLVLGCGGFNACRTLGINGGLTLKSDASVIYPKICIQYKYMLFQKARPEYRPQNTTVSIMGSYPIHGPLLNMGPEFRQPTACWTNPFPTGFLSPPYRTNPKPRGGSGSGSVDCCHGLRSQMHRAMPKKKLELDDSSLFQRFLSSAAQ